MSQSDFGSGVFWWHQSDEAGAADPAPAELVGSEPAATEPAESEPVESEPAAAESAESADPADPAEPVATEPAEPPARSPHRVKQPVIIGVIVLAVVLAGVGLGLGRGLGGVAGWTVWPGGAPGPGYSTPSASRPSATTPSNAPSGPATPSAGVTNARAATMPVDLLAGLPTPDRVTLLGVWGNVALFDFGYVIPTAPPSFRNTVDLSGVLRAVDIKTGMVLWTLDKVPGDRRFFDLSGTGSVAWSDGKLALTLSVIGPDDGNRDPADQFCPSGEYLVVMSALTGRVSASSFYQVSCGDNAAGMVYLAKTITAYTGGVIVVDTGTNLDPAAKTVAFRDTDLDNPLWSDSATSPRVDADGTTSWFNSDAVLPGGWVQTVSGRYAAINDGRSPGAAFPVGGQGATQHALYAAGGLIIDARQTVNPDVGVIQPWIDSLAAWTDAVAAGPAWTYTPAPGWVIAGTEALAPGPILSVTPDAIIILEFRYDDYVLQAAQLTAIRQSDGQKLWSNPYAFTDSDMIINVSFSGGTVTSPFGQIGTTITQDSGSTITTISIVEAPGASDGQISLVTVAAPAVAVVQTTAGATGLIAGGPANTVWLIDPVTGATLASNDKVSTSSDSLAAPSIYPCGQAAACLVTSATTQTVITTLDIPQLDIVGRDRLTLMADALGGGLHPTGRGLFGVNLKASGYDGYAFVLL